MGDPHEDDTCIGPLISESAAESTERAIEDAVKRGAKVLIGGKRKGAFVEPTLLENVPLDAEARVEEIFGPVVLIYPYK